MVILGRRHLHQVGDLVLVARSADRLEEVAKEVTATGRRALAVPADITDDDQVANLVQVASAEYDHIDVLINNAFR
ncbi:SDR family NAD(P)-dependent oxidoreductase, partial [Mycolicibacter sinensis]|uniref:SDR family NAD(P)-dependent oxidoreductase n=1 Tax=Mycolicibacter sinensis (strain JDM601) TaxID=875328 RepID=UPI003D160422